jgi:formimidoylglutamate deiminase
MTEISLAVYKQIAIMSIHKMARADDAVIFARKALLATGWAEDVLVDVDDGVISHIAPQSKPETAAVRVDTLLPALGNLHSHTFQRAMAGMTEKRAAGRDSFWTWRDLMYRFVDHLTPDHIEAIAALAFMEMLECGYASVGEFHYVHHQRGGARYDQIAELSSRIFAAAKSTGIGLTHLPVLYTHGGAGKVALASGQLRFGNDVYAFLKLVDAARIDLRHMPADCRIGIAPHSLRATSPDELKVLLQAHDAGPIHMHIAEQTKEVEDIQGWLGARPVEWLLANADVNADWCLIHATHMHESETLAMAKSGAVAGLCPVTEANLGDGIFNGVSYLNAAGAFGVGTDSNVNISLVEELRTLEYSQRLRDHSRNVMVVDEGSVGQALYTHAAKGSAQALGRHAGDIAVGKLADLIAVDSQTPALCALRHDQLLDGVVFAAKDHVITDVWSAGRHAIQAGQHKERHAIIANYKKVVTAMMQVI